jgi:hypothetical protein
METPMRKRGLVFIGLLSFPGCSGNGGEDSGGSASTGAAVTACEAFNVEYQSCYEAMGSTEDHTIDCTGMPDDREDFYTCLADLYGNAECTSSDSSPSSEEADACEN